MKKRIYIFTLVSLTLLAMSTTAYALLFKKKNKAKAVIERVILNQQASSQNQAENKPELSITEEFGINIAPEEGKSYQQILSMAAQRKSKWKRHINHNEGKISSEMLDSVRWEYTDLLVNIIIPYWYGTEWDFNGYTNIPNQGEIACGYFVSTTMKHTKLNLNRYKLAQQAALNEIKSIQPNHKYHSYPGMTAEMFVEKAEAELKDGLYMIGLDFHVGYMLKKKDTLLFIHSDYISDRVKIERASESLALEASNNFYLGDITHNDDLLKKWLLDQEIIIVTS